jgi:hypothetical protein
MSTQSYLPYRGYRIEVRVKPRDAISSSGRRFMVVWSIRSMSSSSAQISGFPEHVDSMYEADALEYGETKARRFVDWATKVPR